MCSVKIVAKGRKKLRKHSYCCNSNNNTKTKTNNTVITINIQVSLYTNNNSRCPKTVNCAEEAVCLTCSHLTTCSFAASGGKFPASQSGSQSVSQPSVLSALIDGSSLAHCPSPTPSPTPSRLSSSACLCVTVETSAAASPAPPPSFSSSLLLSHLLHLPHVYLSSVDCAGVTASTPSPLPLPHPSSIPPAAADLIYTLAKLALGGRRGVGGDLDLG